MDKELRALKTESRREILLSLPLIGDGAAQMSAVSDPVDARRPLGDSSVEQLRETIRMLLIRMLDDVKVVESEMHQRHFKRAENRVKWFREFLDHCVAVLNQPLGQDIGSKELNCLA